MAKHLISRFTMKLLCIFIATLVTGSLAKKNSSLIFTDTTRIVEFNGAPVDETSTADTPADHFIVRSNLKGSVKFVVNKRLSLGDMKIKVRLSDWNGANLSTLNVNYTRVGKNKRTILLHVSEAIDTKSSLELNKNSLTYIIATGSACLAIILLSVLSGSGVYFYKKYKKKKVTRYFVLSDDESSNPYDSAKSLSGWNISDSVLQSSCGNEGECWKFEVGECKKRRCGKDAEGDDEDDDSDQDCDCSDEKGDEDDDEDDDVDDEDNYDGENNDHSGKKGDDDDDKGGNDAKEDENDTKSNGDDKEGSVEGGSNDPGDKEANDNDRFEDNCSQKRDKCQKNTCRGDKVGHTCGNVKWDIKMWHDIVEKLVDAEEGDDLEVNDVHGRKDICKIKDAYQDYAKEGNGGENFSNVSQANSSQRDHSIGHDSHDRNADNGGWLKVYEMISRNSFHGKVALFSEDLSDAYKSSEDSSPETKLHKDDASFFSGSHVNSKDDTVTVSSDDNQGKSSLQSDVPKMSTNVLLTAPNRPASKLLFLRHQKSGPCRVPDNDDCDLNQEHRYVGESRTVNHSETRIGREEIRMADIISRNHSSITDTSAKLWSDSEKQNQSPQSEISKISPNVPIAKAKRPLPILPSFQHQGPGPSRVPDHSNCVLDQEHLCVGKSRTVNHSDTMIATEEIRTADIVSGRHSSVTDNSMMLCSDNMDENQSSKNEIPKISVNLPRATCNRSASGVPSFNRQESGPNNLQARSGQTLDQEHLRAVRPRIVDHSETMLATEEIRTADIVSRNHSNATDDSIMPRSDDEKQNQSPQSEIAKVSPNLPEATCSKLVPNLSSFKCKKSGPSHAPDDFDRALDKEHLRAVRPRIVDHSETMLATEEIRTADIISGNHSSVTDCGMTSSEDSLEGSSKSCPVKSAINESIQIHKDLGKTVPGKSTEDISDNSSPRSRRGSRRSRSSFPGNKFLFLVFCLAIISTRISESAGYNPLQTISADITIDIPPEDFIDVHVLFNEIHNNPVLVGGDQHVFDLKVFDFDSLMTILQNENKCTEKKQKTCDIGICNPLTGECVCPRGQIYMEALAKCIPDCSRECPFGLFMAKACSDLQPGICKSCRPACPEGEYETTPCGGAFDRECRDISFLPPAVINKNLMTENRLQAKSFHQRISFTRDSQYQPPISIVRGTGIETVLNIIRVNFDVVVGEVNHKYYDEDTLSTHHHFCTRHIPDYYIARRTFAKRRFYFRKNGGEQCESDNPHLLKGAVHCLGPDHDLVRYFGNRKSYDAGDMKFIEKPGTCSKAIQSCLDCRKQCAVNSNSKKCAHRQQNCFIQCETKKCVCRNKRCPCYLYETSNCFAKRTGCIGVKANVVTLQPMFSREFSYCHVKLLRLASYEIRSDLYVNGSFVKSKKHIGNSVTDNFGYLNVKAPDLLKMRDKKYLLLRRNTRSSLIDIGYYKSNAKQMTGEKLDKIVLLPKLPFGVNKMTWGKAKCNDIKPESFTNFDVYPLRKQTPNFFHKLGDFPVAHTSSAALNYTKGHAFAIRNSDHKRYLDLSIPQNKSILRHFYPAASILNDHSLVCRLVNKTSFYSIEVKGKLKSCPGSFSARLFDQDYPKAILHHYDFVVKGPVCTFDFQFNIPSKNDIHRTDKAFVLHLASAGQVIEVVVVREREVTRILHTIKLPKQEPSKLMNILMPISTVAGGFVLLLLVLLLFGVMTRPKDKQNQGDRDNEFHFRHVFFIIWYVGARLAKSLLFTILFLSYLFTVIHSKNYHTLATFKRFLNREHAVYKMIYTDLEKHRREEIHRQEKALIEEKNLCDQKIQKLDEYLAEHRHRQSVKQEMEKRAYSIKNLALKKIEKNLAAAEANYDARRQDFNNKIATRFGQIRSLVDSTQGKVMNNKFFKGANVFFKMYKFFGGSKNFVQYVGLSANFHGLKYKYHIGNIKQGIVDLRKKVADMKKTQEKKDQSRIQEVEKEAKKTIVFKRPNIRKIRYPKPSRKFEFDTDQAKNIFALSWISKLMKDKVLSVAAMAVMLAMDVLFFIYRHTRTYAMAVLMVYGFKKYCDLDDLEKERIKREEEKLLADKAAAASSDHASSQASDTEVIYDRRKVKVTSATDDESLSSQKGSCTKATEHCRSSLANISKHDSDSSYPEPTSEHSSRKSSSLVNISSSIGERKSGTISNTSKHSAETGKEELSRSCTSDFKQHENSQRQSISDSNMPARITGKDENVRSDTDAVIDATGNANEYVRNLFIGNDVTTGNGSKTGNMSVIGSDATSGSETEEIVSPSSSHSSQKTLEESHGKSSGQLKTTSQDIIPRSCIQSRNVNLTGSDLTSGSETEKIASPTSSHSSQKTLEALHDKSSRALKTTSQDIITRICNQSRNVNVTGSDVTSGSETEKLASLSSSHSSQKTLVALHDKSSRALKTTSQDIITRSCDQSRNVNVTGSDVTSGSETEKIASPTSSQSSQKTLEALYDKSSGALKTTSQDIITRSCNQSRNVNVTGSDVASGSETEKIASLSSSDSSQKTLEALDDKSSGELRTTSKDVITGNCTQSRDVNVTGSNVASGNEIQKIAGPTPRQSLQETLQESLEESCGGLKTASQPDICIEKIQGLSKSCDADVDGDWTSDQTTDIHNKRTARSKDIAPYDCDDEAEDDPSLADEEYSEGGKGCKPRKHDRHIYEKIDQDGYLVPQQRKQEPSVAKDVDNMAMSFIGKLGAFLLAFVVKMKKFGIVNVVLVNTYLIPMFLLLGFLLVAVYFVIVTAKFVLHTPILDEVGFFDLKISPIVTYRKAVNTRTGAHAFMINHVHIPYYEARVNARIEMYRLKASLYKKLQCARSVLYNSEFCSWADGRCNGIMASDDGFYKNITKFKCHMKPTIPRKYSKFDRIQFKMEMMRSYDPYVQALRGIILDTFDVILAIIGIQVFIKLFSSSVFKLLLAFDLIRQIKVYKTKRPIEAWTCKG